MTKITKKQKEALSLFDNMKLYSISEAMELVKKTSKAKFDETVDLSINLGIDPKHADQMIRGAVVLPNGLGKDIRVLVFATGEKETEAKEAGADFVGGEDLIEKIKGGWLGFDTTIAIPPMMAKVGKIGKILGTRGLMPNPKVGTVTMEIKEAVKQAKAGKVQFRAEKAGIIHAHLGKVSFDVSKLVQNMEAFMVQIVKMKPSAAKGTYLEKITVSSTMGPGIKIDPLMINLKK